MTQLTGLLGQAGQIVSAVPFAQALHDAGWQPAFLAAAATCAASFVLSAVFLRDSPTGVRTRPPAQGESILGQVRGVWAVPGTRLGFWTHFTTSFSAMAFALMWGFPYLTAGEGLPRQTASLLMTLFAVAGLLFGPSVGVLTQHHPFRRSNLALGVIALNVMPWTLVLAWPGPAPLWALVLLMIGMASGGPGSAIGFDFARTFVPPRRLGTATGMVIMGGFSAALVAILAMGLVLDVTRRGPGDDLHAFRLAMASQMPLFVIGIVGMYRSRRLVRAGMARDGVVVSPLSSALRRHIPRRTPPSA